MTNIESVKKAISISSPDVIINCIGLIKQLDTANDPLHAVPINTLLPHQLSAMCKNIGARLIHISTDCVFSGKKGNYLESDFADAYDLYGRSKFLGEVHSSHAVTLRTSIIGHELTSKKSLICWFLDQHDTVKGFTNAIFSGLPTLELANIVHKVVLPHKTLSGLYHVATTPINKFDLLNLVAKAYSKNIVIVPDNSIAIDRSLNAQRFAEATGYVAPQWELLIQKMHEFQQKEF